VNAPRRRSGQAAVGATASGRSAGRETDEVSELPPPPPPPPGAERLAGAARPAAPGPPGRAQQATRPAGGPPADGQWDWDRVKELAEWWFRPLRDREGWLALGFLFASAVASPFLFSAMAAVAAITFGLAFIVVGVFLVVPFFLMVEQFVRIERHVARIAGHEIELREPAPLPGRGLAAAKVAITDSVRWRHVGFVAVNTLLAPIFVGFGGFPASFVIQVVLGDGVIDGPGFAIGTGIEVGALGLLAVPLAVVAAGAIPRVAIWMAGIKAQVDGWFFGTDQLAEAQRRVATLSDQRQEILDAVATERRRIERNLHDGVQQQLVAIGLDLGMAANHIDKDPERARELIGSARHKVQGSIGELRQLGRGLHPAILEDRGIDAALSAIVAGSSIPISTHVDGDLELSTDVAETVYFVANEAIANVLKHARARVASVHVTKVAANVRVTVHDDGVGGADPDHGTGLAGIRARVNAVDGALTITSPAGGPTTLVAEIPRQPVRSTPPPPPPPGRHHVPRAPVPRGAP
jgi:signal transduction histidine kinase